jgi:hypothetical protein
VDESGSEMCHHCKGDTWHVRMADVAGPYDTWQVHLIVDWVDTSIDK